MVSRKQLNQVLDYNKDIGESCSPAICPEIEVNDNKIRMSVNGKIVLQGGDKD